MGFIMNTLCQFLNKPRVIAVFVLICCLYVLHLTTTRFLSDMKKGRDDMVTSLRQAQTSEPQIAAISQAFDRITSEVDDVAMSLFGFTSVVLVAAFAVRHKEPPRHDAERQAQGELRHGHVA